MERAVIIGSALSFGAGLIALSDAAWLAAIGLLYVGGIGLFLVGWRRLLQ